MSCLSRISREYPNRQGSVNSTSIKVSASYFTSNNEYGSTVDFKHLFNSVANVLPV